MARTYVPSRSVEVTAATWSPARAVTVAPGKGDSPPSTVPRTRQGRLANAAGDWASTDCHRPNARAAAAARPMPQDLTFRRETRGNMKDLGSNERRDSGSL